MDGKKVEGVKECKIVLQAEQGSSKEEIMETRIPIFRWTSHMRLQ